MLRHKKICSKHFTIDDYEDVIEAKLMGVVPKRLKKMVILFCLLISHKLDFKFSSSNFYYYSKLTSDIFIFSHFLCKFIAKIRCREKLPRQLKGKRESWKIKLVQQILEEARSITKFIPTCLAQINDVPI